MEATEDFVSDLGIVLAGRMKRSGVAFDETLSPAELLSLYTKLEHRTVDPQPRTVHQAKDFTCPPELAEGLRQLVEKVRRGENLNPHLSTGIKNSPDKHDMMLNDWGILHFHLGTRTRADGFVERTRPLLYARIVGADFFMLDVREHGAWASQDLLEIIDANWSSTLPKLDGVLPARSLTDEQVAQLRKAGIIPIVATKSGGVVMPPGGGFATAGNSVVAQRREFQLRKTARQFQKMVIAEKDALLARLREKVGEFPPTPVFHLTIDDDGFAFAYIEGVDCAVKLGPFGGV